VSAGDDADELEFEVEQDVDDKGEEFQNKISVS
jgi:hypothetical protein